MAFAALSQFYVAINENTTKSHVIIYFKYGRHSLKKSLNLDKHFWVLDNQISMMVVRPA